MHGGLRAAEGWIELGNFTEAAGELHNLPSETKSSIEVLRLWVRAHAGARAWTNSEKMCELILHHVPGDEFATLQLAEALHQQGKSSDAVLFLGQTKLGRSTARGLYNLARYLCANNQAGDASSILGMAFDKDRSLRLMALQDRGLEKIWLDVKDG